MKNYYNVLPPTKTDHPLTLTAPLYNLPDGVRDELDALTGTETRRLGVKVFDGTEDIVKFTHAATGVTGFVYIVPDAAIVPDTRIAAMSTHFRGQTFESLYNGTTKGVSLHTTEHAIRFYHTPFDDYSVSDFSSYLAAQYAAGTPVTVVYELAEPITHNNDPLEIPLYPPNCSIGVNDGKMDVEYLSGGEIVEKSGKSLNLVGIDPGTDLQKCVVYGVGEQATTVRGKNLLDVSKVDSPRADTTGVWDGTKLTVTGLWYVQVPFKAVRNTQYCVSAVREGPSIRGRITVYSTTDGTTLGSPISNGVGNVSFNSGENDWILVLFYSSDLSVIENQTQVYSQIQLELGATATAYEPFIPDSPSPDYPAAIPALSDAVVAVGDVQSVRINRKGKRTFHI